MIGNRRFVNIKTSAVTKESAISKEPMATKKSAGFKDLYKKLNAIKSRDANENDSTSDEGFKPKKSFILCKVPQCQYEEPKVKELPKVVPKARSGSYTDALPRKFVKTTKRKSSVGIQPRIDIKVIKCSKAGDKLPKIDDFRQKRTNFIQSGDQE